jgi:hypothetical protein
MSRTLKLALLLCLLGFRAEAQDVQIGQGLVCNTPAQVETYVHAREPAAALAAINQAEPKACAMAEVLFWKGAQVATIRNDKGTFVVTAILVVAFMTAQGPQPVPAKPQFTIFSVKEMAA